MIGHYRRVHAQLNPENALRLPDGRRRETIELVFGDDRDCPSPNALEFAVCGFDAHGARELAFELLTLAEVAEQWERAL